MNISFNPQAGVIYDRFRAMWILNNIDEEQTYKDRRNISQLNEFESLVHELPAKNNELKKLLRPYTHAIMKPEFFLDMPSLWASTDASDFLVKYSKAVSDKPNFFFSALHSMLNIPMSSINESKYFNFSPKDIIQRSFDLITNSEQGRKLKSNVKWDLFTMVSEPSKFLSQIMKLSYQFIPQYEALLTPRILATHRLNTQLKELQENNDLAKILPEVSQQMDWDQCKNISITTSATVGARVLMQDDTFYVILGTYQSEINSSNFHEIQLQKTLEVIHSISDPSRFSIISSILNAPADSQELVARTGFTKANLFYHMNFLLDADLVHADKSNHTNKYALNFDELYFHLKMFSEYLNYHLNITE